MPTKDPTSYSYITYLWVILLSAWGGLVNYNDRKRQGLIQTCNFMDLFREVSASSFVGVLTFWLCEWSELDKLLSAALIGVSGHMGTKAISMMREGLFRKINITPSEVNNER